MVSTAAQPAVSVRPSADPPSRHPDFSWCASIGSGSGPRAAAPDGIAGAGRRQRRSRAGRRSKRTTKSPRGPDLRDRKYPFGSNLRGAAFQSVSGCAGPVGAILSWTPGLREPPAAAFREMEEQEFGRASNLEKALAISRSLSSSSDSAIRAGALLRTARILRALNRSNEAL